LREKSSDLSVGVVLGFSITKVCRTGVEYVLNLKPKTTPTERSEDFSRKLFSQLRQERNRLANEKNIPAYQIFKNVTLTEMARQMPQDAKTMESITGVTSEKFRLYGDHFLAVIWKYKSDTEKLKKRNSAS
jgi:superfamily II DNA helicase RecQ